MNEAQKWVLGLILLILLLHWLLPSGSKPSRLSSIWKAAFTPGASSTPAPTTSGTVIIPDVGPAGPPQGTVGSPSGPTDPLQNDMTQLFNGSQGFWSGPLYNLATIVSGAVANVGGGYLLGTIDGGNGMPNSGVELEINQTADPIVAQATGTFFWRDPRTNQTYQAFSPNLEGRLLAVPQNFWMHGIGSIPDNIFLPIVASVQKVPLSRLQAASKQGNILPQGSGSGPGGGKPNPWATILHGVTPRYGPWEIK